MGKENKKDKDLELNKEEKKVTDISSKKEKAEKPKAEKKAKAPKKEKVDKAKPQKLTLDLLTQEDKKLDKRAVGKIEINGSVYEVEYDTFFRPSKQQKVLDDILGFYEKVDEYGTEILDIATPYFVLLIVKQFTSIEVPDDLMEAMHYMNVLIDLNVLPEVLNMLPQEEVEKVNKLIEDALALFQENLAKTEKEFEEMVKNNQIENKELVGFGNDDEEVDMTEYTLEKDSDEPLN